MSRGVRVIGLTICLVVVSCSGEQSPEATTSTVTTPETTPPPPETTTTETVETSSTTTTSTPTTVPTYLPPDQLGVEAYPVPVGSRPHDVAPADDGGVWYTAQGSGELGWLDPSTGETAHIPLGDGSRPHGVIVDGEGVAWITDGGLNAIVSYDPGRERVTTFPLPDDRPDANLNTAAFDGDGILWFTGQSGGIYGSLDPETGDMEIYDAPRGRGPYGIAATPGGDVFYASLAGSYVGAIEGDGSATVLEPPTPGQGARRVWSDSEGSIWVSEWNSGNLSRYNPGTGEWSTWPLPTEGAAAYAVYVDETDIVWVSDFGANAMVRFDPTSERFDVYPLPHTPGEVRQILGRPGEVWGAESAADHLVVIRTR